MDKAHEETERILKLIEARLNKEYKQASEEIADKLRDYLDRFQKKDEIWRNWVDEAAGTPEYKQRLKEYQDWRVGQIAIGKRWEEMKTQLAEDYHHTNDIAKSIVYGYMPEVYALNFNFGTFQVEKGARLDTSFTLYSRQTVERLMRDDPKLLPDPGKKTAARIAAGKDVLWNKQQIQSVMIQGIVQGKSIPALATDLAQTVGDKNRKAAIRNARTMTTGAQNAGRLDSYTRAEKMGIENQKQWLATLDSRTRHSHRMLDGETVPLKDNFTNGLEYPGDPNGDPSEVYNCRCTMLTVLKGHEINVKDTSLRHNSKLEGMSYEEWKKGKAESNPITLPEEKAEAIKQAYNAEYRRKAGEIGGGGTPKTQPEQPKETKPERSILKTSDFKPAKTTQEAESYASTFVKGGMNLTGKTVSFKGIDIDMANRINERLSTIYENFNIDKLSSLEAFGKVNKKIYSANQDAPFFTTNFGNIGMNATILKDAKTAEKYIKDGESAFSYVIDNIENLTGKQLELAKVYQTAGRSLAGNTVEDMVTHEVGHHLSYMPDINKALTEIQKSTDWKEYAAHLSGYANHSFGEYVAESFGAYYKGEYDLLQPEIIKIFDKMRK